MKRTLAWLVVLVAVLAGLIWLRWAYFSDEARVRRVLRGLAADVSFTASTGAVGKVARLNSFVGRFTEQAVISIEDIVPQAPPISGRGDLQLVAQGAFAQLPSCEVTIHDLVIESVDPARREARVAISASATTGRQGVDFVGQEFKVRLRRNTEGTWLIDRIDAVRSLR